MMFSPTITRVTITCVTITRVIVSIDLLLTSAVLLTFALLSTFAPGSLVGAEISRPNVILIVADDQGCFETPILEISSESIAFRKISGEFRLRPCDPN